MGNKNYSKTVLDHFNKMCEKLLPKDSQFYSMVNLNSSSGGSSKEEKGKRIRPSTSNPYTIGYQFRKKQSRRIFSDREGKLNNQRSKDDIKMTVNQVELINGLTSSNPVKPQPSDDLETPTSNMNKSSGTKEMSDSYFALQNSGNNKVLMSTLSEISKQITQEKEELSKEWEKLKISIKQEQEEREKFKQLKDQELKEIETKKKEIEEIAQNVKLTSESLAKERSQLEVERNKFQHLKEDIDHSRCEFEKQIKLENDLLIKRKHENEINLDKIHNDSKKNDDEDLIRIEHNDEANESKIEGEDISQYSPFKKNFNKDILEDVSPIEDNCSVSEKKADNILQFKHQEEIEVPLDFDETKRSPTDEGAKFFNDNNEQLDRLILEETYLYDPSNFLNDEIYRFSESIDKYKAFQVIQIPEESKYLIIGCEIIEKDSCLCLKLLCFKDNDSSPEEHFIFFDEIKTVLKLISSKDVVSHDKPIKLIRDFKEYVRQFIFNFVIYNNQDQERKDNKAEKESLVIKCSTKGILKNKMHIKFMKKECYVVLKYLHDKTFRITLYIVNNKDGTFNHGIGIDLKCDNAYYNKFKEINLDNILNGRPNFDKSQFVISHELVDSNFILDLKNSIKALEKYAHKYHSLTLNAFVYGEDRSNLINQIRTVSDLVTGSSNQGNIDELHNDRKQLWNVRDDSKNK